MSTLPLHVPADVEPLRGRSVGARLDADRQRAAADAWKEVFEQASEGRAIDPRPHGTEVRSRQGLPTAPHSSSAMPDRNLAAPEIATREAHVAPRLSGSGPVLRSSLSDEANESMSAPGRPSAAAAPAAARPAATPRRIDSELAEIPMPVMIPQPALSLAARPGTDAVSVFVNGGSVTVVVRDSQVSDADAVEAARDVAFHVAGSAHALRSLTLNGRLVYGSADSPAEGADVSTLFSC